MSSASSTTLFRPFPLPLTNKQWFYILFLQGIGAGFIDAGANFGIAYAMYHGQSQVKMWIFSQNTIAGDLGVTCLIQTAVSMLISSTLVHTDLHHHAITPLPFVFPHVNHLPNPETLFRRRHSSSPTSPSLNNETPSINSNPDNLEKGVDRTTGEKKGVSYYWWMFIRFVFEGTERNCLADRGIGFGTRVGRFLWTGLQGLAIGVLFGFPLWCLAIVILGPIYKMDNLGNKWAPQAIKAVFAFFLGIITNPIIALLALGSQAEHHLIPLSQSQQDLQSATSAAVADELSSSPLSPPRAPAMGRNDTRNSIFSSSSSSSSRPRPPLTANVSTLSRASPHPANNHQLHPPSSPIAATNATLSPPQPQSSPMVAGGRPRALTASSYNPSLYSLGGTGGRNQRRPRASSRAGEGGATGGAGEAGATHDGSSLYEEGGEGARRQGEGEETLLAPMMMTMGGRERGASVSSSRSGGGASGGASGGRLRSGSSTGRKRASSFLTRTREGGENEGEGGGGGEGDLGLPVAGRKELPSAWLGAPVESSGSSAPSSLASASGLGGGGGRLGDLQRLEKMEAPRESLEGGREESAELERGEEERRGNDK